MTVETGTCSRIDVRPRYGWYSLRALMGWWAYQGPFIGLLVLLLKLLRRKLVLLLLLLL